MTDTDAGRVPSESAPASPSGDTTRPAKPGRFSALRRRFRIGFDVVLLLVVALAVFLPGFTTIPVTDPDEARFVQATRQMVESGNWIDIRFQDEPLYEAPIGIHWLQGVAVLAGGEGGDSPAWVYRIPSLVGALAAVLLTYAIGVALGGANVGLLAALLAVVTIGLNAEARTARTDAVLLATILAAQWALASMWADPQHERRLGRNLVFWGALGLGILVKGPVILLVAGSTLAVLLLAERSLTLWRALSPLRGLVLMLALVAPWIVAIGIVSDGRFFREYVGDPLSLFVASGGSRGTPPGTHMLMAFATFWPLAAFVPLALVHAVRRSSDRAVIFLLAWIIPGWVVFEILAAKPPNAVLPFMPALAILAALMIQVGALAADRRWRHATLGWIALGAIVLGVGMNVLYILVEGRADLFGIAGAFVVGACGIVAWRLVVGAHPIVGVFATTLTGALVMVLGLGILLPGAERLWMTERLAVAVEANATCPDPTVLAVGRPEPSLVFLTDARTRFVDLQAAAATFRSGSCVVALIPEGDRAAFWAAVGGNPDPAVTVDGVDVDGLQPRRTDVFVRGGF